MPVPVPSLSKPPAHPVIKHHNIGHDDGQLNPSVFQHLTRTLPVSPTGPPPSFGTREQWINSLPSWRRTKPRRIWEDDSRSVGQGGEQQHFQPGLTTADNAIVIKGTRAQACIPPLLTLLEASNLQVAASPVNLSPTCDGDADDEMSSDYSVMDQGQFDNESQWSASSPRGNEAGGMKVETVAEYDVTGGSPSAWDKPAEQVYERGAFTPIFEDESPRGNDAVSSPLGPVTPFGDFVDRAVAAVQPFPSFDNAYVPDGSDRGYFDDPCGPQCYQDQPSYEPITSQTKDQVPAAETVVTPCATDAYKRLAEPLSKWVADYVWKVCTTGMSLPSVFSRSMDTPVRRYFPSPPSYLAGSVHSLLLSTLLQPSAVFLALWYIVRLPVLFGKVGLGPDHIKELRFRIALLEDSHGVIDKDAMEASAPFRLIVLGCMLANKWLDDHTFSNKTWHTISNVPVQALNKLESLTLDIFSYDLSISRRDWSQWLSHVMSYHMSLTSPFHPQPISRPSSNPHSIVRKSIEEIIQAPAACDSTAYHHPQPVFLRLEERRREKLEKEQTSAINALEIDLDEDGPLREEYLPKRRVSSVGSAQRRGDASASHRILVDQDWEHRMVELQKLPPPAKWSPAGDEPIIRERNRTSSHYVAVQPPLVQSMAPYQVLPTYHPLPDYGYANQNWSTGPTVYVPIKQHLPGGYVYDPGSLHLAPPTYNPYPYVVPIALSHSRTQSHSYDQDNLTRNRPRSYSQSQFDYRCGEMRMTTNELVPISQPDIQRAAVEHHFYSAQTYAPHLTLNYQSAWLRT